MANCMDLIEKLKTFLENDPNIIFAFIFGSGARGKQKKGSDIDIGIYFAQPPEGLDLLGFINILSEMAGKDVDIVVLNNASAFLRHQVMKNKINLTIKDRMVYRNFREKTISDYDEYKYVSGVNVYDR
jgi:predicted nucleotidyltransferase